MNINKYLNLAIHIVILILLIIFYINNRNNRKNLIFILVATIIYICYLIEFVNQPNIMGIETFNSPVSYRMGPYSGIKLDNDMITEGQSELSSNNENCDWRKKPCNVPFYQNTGYVGPTGQKGRYIEDPTHNPNMPPIDGDKNSRRSMFMFTHNQCHPDCCPSTYSCDNGCVCTTKKQREFLNRRGFNRSNKVNGSF